MWFALIKGVETFACNALFFYLIFLRNKVIILLLISYNMRTRRKTNNGSKKYKGFGCPPVAARGGREVTPSVDETRH